MTQVGVGVALRQDAFGVYVHRVLHGGPAHLSGKIANGDYMEEVGGTQILNVAEASAHLNGPLSSLVEIRVRQGGGGDSSAVYLLRQDVDAGEVLDDTVGIAAALRVVRDGVTVDQVMPGGGAYICGMVQEGALIVAIDGAKVTGHFHASEISDMIRGPEGSRVTLEVIGEGTSGIGPGPIYDRSKIEFVDVVRMPPVDVSALTRYREALARQIAQASANGHDSRVMPSSPAHQRLSTSLLNGTHSPAYVSSTPQPICTPQSLDHMWGPRFLALPPVPPVFLLSLPPVHRCGREAAMRRARGGEGPAAVRGVDSPPEAAAPFSARPGRTQFGIVLANSLPFCHLRVGQQPK